MLSLATPWFILFNKKNLSLTASVLPEELGQLVPANCL